MENRAVKRYRIAPVVILAAVFTGCVLDYSIFFPPLDVAQGFDVSRYLGKWYEIAKYPVPFEAGCFGVTAEYGLRDDGTVSVLNICRDASFNEQSRIEGHAVIPNPAEPAKLGVFFPFSPVGAPYWVLEVGADYEYAVVGDPSRNTLWILSRTPQLDEAVYNDILSRLPERGYDPGRLELMPQPTP